ncbi:SatD family protein [Chryseobacterium sp. FH1]|uniref:SatD family protein n=1 Tax=Chryseobacterium sp. FH1 TaxID=1233951 RepID=UPI0004E42089|nr:SatD family protein [Chryseobacterium sp. FH1]KFC19254.1 hypothetical protein IO90_08035 [Chryseobacterium sp. FH1]
MKHYILMCDVLNSREKDQKNLIENFRDCKNYINNKYKKNILSPLTITLGDEFQGIIKNLSNSIKIILDLEEFIIKNNFPMKLRYVLYFGEIETEINSDIAYEMLGNGLTDSRRIINNMKENDSRFYIDTKEESKNSILNNGFNILQNIVDKWKIEKDHEIIDSLIEFKDYKIVSEKLNKNRSLVWKREKNLSISSYTSAKEILLVISNI